MKARTEYKVVTLGDGQVGKTSLMLKYVKNEFRLNKPSTINANCMEKDIQLSGTPIRLNIWDTAGQERFKALIPNYYREANGAILVYDITDKDSLGQVRNWVRELRNRIGHSLKIVVAGNKCDRESERNISKEEVIEFTRSIGAPHFFTSAKTGLGVNELYFEIAKLMLSEDNQLKEETFRNSHRRTSRAKGIVIETQPRKRKCC